MRRHQRLQIRRALLELMLGRSQGPVTTITLCFGVGTPAHGPTTTSSRSATAWRAFEQRPLEPVGDLAGDKLASRRKRQGAAGEFLKPQIGQPGTELIRPDPSAQLLDVERGERMVWQLGRCRAIVALLLG